jgi:hypothetical protein
MVPCEYWPDFEEGLACAGRPGARCVAAAVVALKCIWVGEGGCSGDCRARCSAAMRLNLACPHRIAHPAIQNKLLLNACTRSTCSTVGLKKSPIDIMHENGDDVCACMNVCGCTSCFASCCGASHRGLASSLDLHVVHHRQ